MFASLRITFLLSSDGHDVDQAALKAVREMQSKHVRREFRDPPNTFDGHEGSMRTNGNDPTIVTTASKVTTHVLEKRKAEPTRLDMLKHLFTVAEKAYDFAKSRYPEDDERVEEAAVGFETAMADLRKELNSKLNPK
jgi:hypothetical protein